MFKRNVCESALKVALIVALLRHHLLNLISVYLKPDLFIQDLITVLPSMKFHLLQPLHELSSLSFLIFKPILWCWAPKLCNKNNHYSKLIIFILIYAQLFDKLSYKIEIKHIFSLYNIHIWAQVYVTPRVRLINVKFSQENIILL